MKDSKRADARAEIWAHWEGYFQRIMDDEGLTLSEAMLFELVLAANAFM